MVPPLEDPGAPGSAPRSDVVRAVAATPRRVLVIAFHFPPFAGSSGVQRTLRFVQHLPRFGWESLVLTCRPGAYERIDDDLVGEIPSSTIVERAFALDAARHLAIAGRFPKFLAQPDRWSSWWPAAVWRGGSMIRAYRPTAIISTYPIATAHLIGAALARRSGLPWIADFRDPMAQDGYPADPLTWRAYKRVEERVFARAAACTFTTPSAAAEYRSRFPASAAAIEVIENGYDEESFPAASPADGVPLVPGVQTLLHSGIVYPNERDPRALFAALALAKRSGIDETKLRVRFRASHHDAMLFDLALKHQVVGMVEICATMPYRESLAEMLRADGLLLLQAANCNAQIPAKMYEYLRARRPVVALTDPVGDTAGVLRNAGIRAMARLDRAEEIAELIARFVRGDRLEMLPRNDAVDAAARTSRAEQLARLLDRVVVKP
jgi:glycosyltransferase involved in cell wall biosynthesis